MTVNDEIRRRILWYGTDDWVALHALLGEARKAAPEPPDAFKDVVVSVMESLLGEGLAEVGTLADSGFVAFSGGPAEVIATVVARCDETGWRLGGEDNIWLSNTEKGDRLAESNGPDSAPGPAD